MTAILKSRAEAELDRLAHDPCCALHLPLWKMDGDSFASRDKHGHLCTNHGSVWTPQGRRFDGVDDYVDCGNDASLNITDGITIVVWLKIPNGYTARGGVVGKGTAEGYHSVFSVDGGAKMSTYNNAWVYSNSVVNDGSFHQVALTESLAADGCFYKDGVADGTFTYRASDPSGRNLLIARDYQGFHLPGTFGEVLIYNRGLTPPEISYHYIVGKELFA